uniref:Alpha-carbonic anhydrase domain-containing protein n=1 Tax=Cyprinus carpio carpio TaxID=630221 RepID=A0A8C1H1Z2_CYPCA
MIVLLVSFAALLCPTIHSEDASVGEYSTTWPKIAPQYCNGSNQSPINIVTASVQGNPNLTSFNFTGFDDNSTFRDIKNSGESVVVNLDDEKMTVQGGGLPGLYNTVQFHLHWGNGSSSPGSDHTVDGKQYPMELHIVNVHSKYNRNVSAALAAEDSTALAVLGFFIEGTDEVNKPKGWITLTSFLTSIPNSGDEIFFLFIDLSFQICITFCRTHKIFSAISCPYKKNQWGLKQHFSIQSCEFSHRWYKQQLHQRPHSLYLLSQYFSCPVCVGCRNTLCAHLKAIRAGLINFSRLCFSYHVTRVMREH